jgi:cobalt-zinc-cadmium efflux system outer membrane protein
MNCRRVVLLLVLAVSGLLAEAALGEEYNLDSLRLGANYLRWLPNGGGGATAAPTPQSETARLAAAGTPIDAARLAAAGTAAHSEPTFRRPQNAAPAATDAQSEGMSLGELEEIAQRCNPVLALAAARVEAARGEWLQAGLYPNPRAGYLASEINDEHQAGQQGAFFGQEIVTAGKLRRNRDVAAQTVRQAECALAAQRCRVLSDVRRAFYDALVAQRSVELTGQLVRVGQEGERAAESLLRAKEVSRVDLLQARIEADSARILAEKARNRHHAAWRNLAAVAGAGDLQPAPLAGEIQDGLAQWTWDEAIHHVLRDSPVLAEAQAGVGRAEAMVARECAARVPNLDLQASVQYDNATRDAIAGIQAGVPLPWFNRNQGNIRRAEAELAAAQGDVRRVSLDLQQRLAAAFEQYQNARYQVEKYAAEILPNAQTSLDLVAAGYRQGEFNYTTLLTAQRTFFQVNLAYVEAIRDLRSAAVAIEGSLLADSLQQH